MSVMASQITNVSIVYSTICSVAGQRKYKSSASLAFVRGIHRWLVNSPHKGLVTRKMFVFDDGIMYSCGLNKLKNSHSYDGVLLAWLRHHASRIRSPPQPAMPHLPDSCSWVHRRSPRPRSWRTHRGHLGSKPPHTGRWPWTRWRFGWDLACDDHRCWDWGWRSIRCLCPGRQVSPLPPGLQEGQASSNGMDGQVLRMACINCCG